MKTIFLKILLLLMMLLFINACTTETDDSSNDPTNENYYDSNDDYSNDSTDNYNDGTTSNALEDWRKPRVFAKATVDEKCNTDKVFSLRPHQVSVSGRIVDFTTGGDSLSGYSARAVHTQDPNSVVSLQFDGDTYWVNDCATVTYVDKKDIYPSYWVEAINDANGSVVTRDKVVMFDGGTDNCMACHASNSSYPLAYASNPANLTDAEIDYKTNILRVHDKKHPNAASDYLTQLQAKGLNYDANGLEATSNTLKVSCTDCHGINAVQGSGFKSIASLTNALHDVHANLSEPNIKGANNCFTCHPGETISKTFSGKIVHPFDAAWRDEDGHGEWAEDRGVSSCTLCHGTDLRGTKISNNISCYKCHGREW